MKKLYFLVAVNDRGEPDIIDWFDTEEEADTFPVDKYSEDQLFVVEKETDKL
ncbi:MAG: hypothetical protein LC122_14280 [Chitinophagales bacterium]|nr:hypothetical protein [Chitinophagales bacterium]